jgi:hypothetical protein
LFSVLLDRLKPVDIRAVRSRYKESLRLGLAFGDSDAGGLPQDTLSILLMKLW